jgi:hypothetical protein
MRRAMIAVMSAGRICEARLSRSASPAGIARRNIFSAPRAETLPEFVDGRRRA